MSSPQSVGAHRSWANTPDRAKRTAAARAASPLNLEYWLAKQDPDRFAGATAEQRLQAAESARTAWLKANAAKSVAARRAKRQQPTVDEVVEDIARAAIEDGAE